LIDWLDIRWSSHADWGSDECAPCDEPAGKGSFCDVSRFNCERSCSNAVWCEGPWKAEDKGNCCLWSSHADWGSDACAPCDDLAKAGTFCAHSKYNCEQKCSNAAWCAEGFQDPAFAVPKPVAKPTPWHELRGGGRRLSPPPTFVEYVGPLFGFCSFLLSLVALCLVLCGLPCCKALGLPCCRGEAAVTAAQVTEFLSNWTTLKNFAAAEAARRDELHHGTAGEDIRRPTLSS
jgi:hypothetical protein